MATYNPPRIGATSTAILAVDVRELNDGIVGRGLTRFRQLLCALRGHDNLMQFEKERLSLQCASCGHESPGWALTEAPPKVVLRGDNRRHALVRARLVSAERRIA
jgi:hypothetical protein